MEGETNNEENNRGDTIAAAVAAAVAPKSVKKKTVSQQLKAYVFLELKKYFYCQEKHEKLIKSRVVQSKNNSKEENDIIPPAKRSRHTLGERNYDGDHELSFSSSPRRANDAVNQLLNRPQLLVQRPVREKLLCFYSGFIFSHYININIEFS